MSKTDNAVTVKDFAESIFKRWSTIHILGEGEKKIIPKGLSHEFLLENLNIDAEVKEYYYKACSEMLEDSDFEKLYASGFTGNRETFLHPYSVSFYGAYHFRKSLYSKLHQISWDDSLRLNGKSIENLKDIFPYFEEYSKGFKVGFDTFQDVQIEKYLTKYSNSIDFAQKVFDFIIVNNWKNNRVNFKTYQDYNREEKVFEIIHGYYDGEIEGFFYRAWSIIFSQSKLFLPLFESQKAIQVKESIIVNEPEVKDSFDLMEEPEIKLEHIFESGFRLNKIRGILIEKGFIQEHTYLWIDKTKGNKGFLAALIKNFHSKGYYKNNILPGNDQIVKITENSFGWRVSLDTVKKSSSLDFDFKFIPPATTF